MRKTVSFTVKIREMLLVAYDLFSGEMTETAGGVVSEGGGRGLLMRG
jgi:hypothetical protein